MAATPGKTRTSPTCSALLTPQDTFEAGRPDRGVSLRVRCARVNNGQGRAVRPLAELVTLSVDGNRTAPELVTKPAPNGSGIVDHFHQLCLPDPAPGPHTAEAVVQVLATNEPVRRAIRFWWGASAD